jgi:16S rRNA (cytidine1402-2'-O)-methyltransferase
MFSERTLYIVATPIGNRDDLSARAIELLQQVDRIYAEDTRHSLPLLRHHGIDTRAWALHEHNEESQIDMVIEHLNTGASAALITDAGTPLISDPGYRLVRACHGAGVRVSTVPGPCAVTAALSVSGLPTDRFQFVGFPPSKSGARQKWLQPLAQLPHTIVIYESPHRIVDSLNDIASVFGDSRPMTLARELTKRFETLLHGSVRDVISTVLADANQQRGEFVLVLAGTAMQDESSQDVMPAADLDKTLSVLLEHLPVKTVARCAAELCGVTRKTAYDRALQQQRR